MGRVIRGLGELAIWVGLPLVVFVLLLVGPVWQMAFAFPYWMLRALSEYPATALTLAVLLLHSAWATRRRTAMTQRWLPTYFIPTYVAGFEATRDLANIRVADCFSAECMGYHLYSGAAEAACVLATTLICGSVCANACERATWWRIRLHPVLGAIVVSVALPWIAAIWLLRALYR
jgi:hypothetical protein